MSDTKMSAAPGTHPADVAKTEATSNGAQLDAHPANGENKASGETKAQEKDNDSGEETWALNGDSRDRGERLNSRDERNRNRAGNWRGGRGGRGGGRGGRGGRGGFGHQRPHYKRNDEFDDLPESSDRDEMRHQVEFYFHVRNLEGDWHLFNLMDGPANKPVSIKHIAQFKRMKHFRPYSAIVEALRESKMLIVVDDGEYHGLGNEAVKLRVPLAVPVHDTDDPVYPPPNEDLFERFQKAAPSSIDRSVYVKGFAEDDKQMAMEMFFSPYGASAVRKRREQDTNIFKGSVFVEFDTDSSQQQFLALDPKPQFHGKELDIMSKRDYIDKKAAENGTKPNYEASSARRNNFLQPNRGGQGNRGGSRGRGGFRSDRRRRDDMYERRRRPARGSPSGSDVESDDWNKRRDRFRDGRSDRRGHRRDDRDEESRKSIERDDRGSPAIKDTRVDAEIAASKKRKAETEVDHDDEKLKKSKIDIMQDE